MLVTFRDNVTALSPESRLDLLSEFEGQGLETGADSDQLRLLAVTISTIEDPGKHPSESTRAVSNILIKLSGRLWLTADYRQFCLIAQCMGLIMRQKPWSMTQWGIDTAVSAITLTVSPSGPQLAPQHAGPVYQHLCGLMGSILAVHRTKLGGRYHLIIPLLQGMLRCLFTPDVRRARSAKTISLPPWLSGKGTKLDASSAAVYARLLTTICEPTVSSVTSSKNRSRQDLNDETKKVRAIAGQYLPYLIMEYSQCQLNARIPPVVKAALMPGLYAVFDVMSQETMRTLNAAMDSSSRAIFKALYDDYRRFGK